MDIFLLTIFITTELLYYLILIDIILSWLSLTWLNLNLSFINNILDPIYERVRNSFKTNFFIFDFTPIIVILFLVFIQYLITLYDKNIILNYNNFLSF